MVSLLSTTDCNLVIPSRRRSSEKTDKSIAAERGWSRLNWVGFVETRGIDFDNRRQTLDDSLVLAQTDKAKTRG